MSSLDFPAPEGSPRTRNISAGPSLGGHVFTPPPDAPLPSPPMKRGQSDGTLVHHFAPPPDSPLPDLPTLIASPETRVRDTSASLPPLSITSSIPTLSGQSMFDSSSNLDARRPGRKPSLIKRNGLQSADDLISDLPQLGGKSSFSVGLQPTQLVVSMSEDPLSLGTPPPLSVTSIPELTTPQSIGDMGMGSLGSTGSSGASSWSSRRPEKVVDRDERNSNFSTKVIDAINNTNMKELKKLISGDIDINEPDGLGNSPLHHAILSSNFKGLKVLMENDADINIVNNEGNTPLHLACIIGAGRELITYILSSENILPYVRNNKGQLPINLPPFNHKDVSIDDKNPKRHEDLLKMMRQLIDPRWTKVGQVALQKRSETVLHKALDNKKSSLKITKTLKAALGKKKTISTIIDTPNQKGKTALHLATELQNTYAMHMLLSAGANVNVQDDNGNTPLHMSCMSGFFDGIRLLLMQRGVKICIHNKISRKYPTQLGPYAEVAQPENADSEEAQRKVLYSLLKVFPKGTLTVVPQRGKKLLESKDAESSDPILYVSYDNETRQTEVQRDNPNPVWSNLDWSFEVFNEQSVINIEIVGEVEMAADDILGVNTLLLEEIKEMQLQKKKQSDAMWVKLFDRKGKPKLGEIQMVIKYEPYELSELLVDPETMEKFEPMINLLVENEYEYILVYEAHMKPNDEMARALMHVMDMKDNAVDLLFLMLNVEVEKCRTENTLFRIDSWTTKMMKAFFREVGTEFLSQVLGPFVNSICEDPGNYELEPLRMKPGEDPDENFAILKHHVEEALDTIFNAVDMVPYAMRLLFKATAEATLCKYPDALYRSVGGFVFLRFFCAGLAATVNYGLTSVIPQQESLRCLVLVAKVIQNIANGVQFSFKEPHLKVFNEFIMSKQEGYKNFIDSLIDVEEGQSLNIDLNRRVMDLVSVQNHLLGDSAKEKVHALLPKLKEMEPVDLLAQKTKSKKDKKHFLKRSKS